MKVPRIDLKRCNLPKNLAQDHLELRNIIHVADPTQLRQGFGDVDDDVYGC